MKQLSSRNHLATVVVVNDDETQITLLTALLHKDKIEVASFLDAEAALETMAKDGPPDLIITDLYMPGLDGWRFCRLLRSPEYQSLNKTPILVISATFAGDEAASITADLGADAFLTSPVDARQFITHVHKLLGGERSQQQLRVLIVEDSKTLQGILKRAFDAQGYWTETALTRKEAVAAFSKAPWDVAVIDYHLPDGEGDDLLSDFRAKQRDCVCIMMTTDPAPELAISWMKKGAAAYLRKPFAPEYLIELCIKTRRERALLRVQDLLEMRTQELRESEERYRTLVENATDMVFRTDANGNFTFANPAALRFAGYEKEEIIGRQYTILLPPEKREEALLFFGHQLIKGIPNTYSEYPVITKDGREFWVGQNAQLIVEGDTFSGFQIMARDITGRIRTEKALRETAERLQRFFEMPLIGIAITSLEKGWLEINDALCNILGYPREKLLEMNWAELTHPDDLEADIANFDRVLAGEINDYTMEKRFIHADGRAVPSELAVRCVRKPDGQVDYIVAMVKDITERKQAEETLQKAYANLETKVQERTLELKKINEQLLTEIDERKRADEALRESEERSLLLLNSAAEAIYGLDMNGNCTFCNNACLRLLGYKHHDELLGKNMHWQIHAKHADGTPFPIEECRIIQSFKKGEGTHVDDEVLWRSDGTSFPAEYWSYPQINKGAVVGAVVTFWDITARKEAENTLRESEYKYKNLIENIPDIIFTIDLEGKIIFVNQRIKEILGYKSEEIINVNIFKLLPEDVYQKAMGSLQKGMKGEKIKKYQIPMMAKSGERLFFECSFSRVYKDGAVVGAQGTAVDITERKQIEESLRESEDRYKNLVENSFSFVYVIQDGCFVFLNNNAIKFTGYEPKDIIGKPADSFVHPEDRGKIRGKAKKMLSGEDISPYEFRIVSKAGQLRWLMETVALINFNGRPAILGNCIDITERRQREVQELHSQKLESVGQLAAGIAHEINTPIQFVGDNISFMKGAFQDILSLTNVFNTIKSDDLSNPAVAGNLLALIQKKEKEIDLDFLGKEIPQAIEQSLEGLQRVSKIVMAMREFSHPGGEGKSAMDINKAIESTIILAHNEWKYCADLTTTLAPDLPKIQGYPSDFNQVILNIIINATHALQEKAGKGNSEKGRIEISTRLDGKEVEICIRDTGMGIPPEAQSRVFDPFFTTKTVGKGTGQGLAIAQNIIVQKHGGKLYFETKVGEGTAFYIRLPLETV